MATRNPFKSPGRKPNGRPWTAAQLATIANGGRPGFVVVGHFVDYKGDTTARRMGVWAPHKASDEQLRERGARLLESAENRHSKLPGRLVAVHLEVNGCRVWEEYP